MGDVSVQVYDSRKRVRQQIMVPFLWEDRPGLPKRDWKPISNPLPPPALPVKHVVTVPFKWEEKPGTPLRCFGQDPSESNQQQQQKEHSYLPPPPGYLQRYDNNDGYTDTSDDDEYEDWDSVSDSEFEAVSNQTCESFGSAPTLTANNLVPTAAISSAVSLEKNTYPMEKNEENNGTAFSPESRECVSSYATVNASLKGNTFLEHLFPLYPPKSGLLDKTHYSPQKLGGADKVFYAPKQKRESIDRERNHQNVVIRRPLTLGELIMLSRRRSCRKKAVQMRETMLTDTEEFSEMKAPGCCIFKGGNVGIAKLLGTKSLLSMKFT